MERADVRRVDHLPDDRRRRSAAGPSAPGTRCGPPRGRRERAFSSSATPRPSRSCSTTVATESCAWIQIELTKRSSAQGRGSSASGSEKSHGVLRAGEVERRQAGDHQVERGRHGDRGQHDQRRQEAEQERTAGARASQPAPIAAAPSAPRRLEPDAAAPQVGDRALPAPEPWPPWPTSGPRRCARSPCRSACRPAGRRGPCGTSCARLAARSIGVDDRAWRRRRR